MDAFHEKEQIARQNREWALKKTKRKNNLEKDHPWLKNDKRVQEKADRIWYNITTPENQQIIDTNNNLEK